MSDVGLGSPVGANPYVNDTEQVKKAEPKPEKHIIASVAKSAPSGVLITTAAGTATTLLMANALSVTPASVKPIVWGLIAGAAVAGAWASWASK
jgi:hypothetical protein